MNIATIGSIPIPLLASLNVRQTYPPNVRETIIPLGDGSSTKRVYAGTAGKLRTILSGSGPVPPGLDGLDATQPQLLLCAAERSINSALANIDIPNNRRSDAGYEPWGRAFVGADPVPTPVAMAGDTAQLTPVAGATAYQVLWFPILSVWIEGGVQTTNEVDAALVQWSLSMREV